MALCEGKLSDLRNVPVGVDAVFWLRSIQALKDARLKGMEREGLRDRKWRFLSKPLLVPNRPYWVVVIEIYGCFYKLGLVVVGVLRIRALIFGVCIIAGLDFFETPKWGTHRI